MIPPTLLAAQKVSDLLTVNGALQQALSTFNTTFNLNIPTIPAGSVVLSSASANLADLSMQLTYPRVCVYASALKNSQLEKYRPLSGTISVVADVLTSADLVDDTDQWIHFYVEALTGLLRKNLGDWGDGVFFPGTYDVQFSPPKAGGLGFLMLARVTMTMVISGN